MALRTVVISMLLLSCAAMFKRDMKSVMEEEFPDLGNLGDTIAKATQDASKILDKGKAIAQKTVNHLKNEGEEAVQGVKEMAIKAFTVGAGQVNQTLQVVGAEVQRLNATALREIQTIDVKVNLAKNKTAAFAEGALELVDEVEPVFDQFLERLKEVNQMATQVLRSLDQERALMALDVAMEKAMITANKWKSATEDLAKELAKATIKFTGRNISAIRSRPERREERRERRSERRNDTNTTETEVTATSGVETEAPVLLQFDATDELSHVLKSPMQTLSSAAKTLKNMASETTTAMGKLVDAGIEAAQKRVPDFLMDNVTNILEDLKVEATNQLQPLGAVGQEIVDGLYKASDDAGLHLRSNALRSLAVAPCALAMFLLFLS